jgi:predicted nucleotidyltransferase
MSVKKKDNESYSSEVKKFLPLLSKEVRSYYGDRLVSFAVFGSVARGRFRPDSDIDCLIVAERLPKGRVSRVSEFQRHIEKQLDRDIRTLHKKGIHVLLSPVFKTVEELEKGSPLFLDMVYDVMILYDRENVLKRFLERLKKKLDKLGSRRIVRGNAWYWVLKPDYKFGETIEL